MHACSPSETGRAVLNAAHAESFERMTMPHLPHVARFARSLTRDAVRAEDLVQETYLQALRGWHTFRTGADARPWLFKVCHNAFLRSMHQESRYVDAPDDDPELESLATAHAHWHAEQAGLTDVVERMDLGESISRALGELPAYFRGAVVLVDVEGQSYDEAAAVLGIPVGTVRSRLFRARRLLQDLLFEHARDAGFAAARPASPERTSARPEEAE